MPDIMIEQSNLADIARVGNLITTLPTTHEICFLRNYINQRRLSYFNMSVSH